MSEKAKRLAPKGETLRKLFLLSGNFCAFPNCSQLMMNANGIFVGQVCHIEAAEEDGERFNRDMSNEDRRAASNLMLMCYPHHQETNDVAAFPVEKLKQIKGDHERRFSHPDRAILETLTDWTERDIPTEVKNLKTLDAVLGWDASPADLQGSVDELNTYIGRLRAVPLELRKFLGAISKRVKKMEKTAAVRNVFSGTLILVSDLEAAFQLTPRGVAERVGQLSSYGLAGIDEIDTELGSKPAVCILNLKSGWPLWSDLVLFCDRTAERIETFACDLDFSRLDG